MRFWRTPGALCCALVVTAILNGVPVTNAQDNGGCPLPPVELPLFDATPASVVAAATPAVPEEPDDEEIVVAAQIIVDCISTGDASLRYAVFTDRYLALQFTDEGGAYQPEFERLIDQRAVADDVTWEFVSVEAITRRDDGRVEITLTIRGQDREISDRLILARQGEYWLIDEVVETDAAQ